jgi:prophage regulatory protein
MVFLQKSSHDLVETATKVNAQAVRFTHPDEVSHRTPALLRQRATTPARTPARGALQATGLGRSTIYRLIANGAFPAPVRLGPRAVAWRWSDLDQWTQSRPGTH